MCLHRVVYSHGGEMSMGPPFSNTEREGEREREREREREKKRHLMPQL